RLAFWRRHRTSGSKPPRRSWAMRACGGGWAGRDVSGWRRVTASPRGRCAGWACWTAWSGAHDAPGEAMGHERDIQWPLAPAWPGGVGGRDLERWREAMAPVKLTPHRDVFRVRFAGHDFHLKHFRPDEREWLRSWFRPPKARTEFDIGRELLKRGVGTL